MPKLITNSFETLDDLLYDVYSDLIDLPSSIKASRGVTSELIGTTLILTNPRARLSRSEVKSKAFSAVGELLWYLAGSNSLDFIRSYIKKYEKETDDGVTIHGAYGPRLFNKDGKYNQIKNVIELLNQKPSTRRAVIQLFDASDLAKKHSEIPCTCTLQFFIREEKLDLHVSMRSNDVFMGLPHDVFAFTMLQEIMAVTLKVELGNYYHTVGSLHLYDTDRIKVRQYLDEGYQSTKLFMPSMPLADPWPSISKLIAIEENIRTNQALVLDGLENYWTEIAKLVQIHFLHKKKDINGIKNLMVGMNKIYIMYIENKIC
jgi:thymidylate synthase